MAPIRISALLATVLFLALAAGAANAAPGDLSGPTCISKAGTDGCEALPEPEMLTDAASVVVAPDGSDVYVGAAGGVAHFRRAADGSLTYDDCVDVSSATFSACPTEAPSDSANALSSNSILLAMAPNGTTLYAVSWADALLWWNRDPDTGDLTWGGCRDAAATAATNGHCGTATTFAGGNFPAGALDYSQGIAVTPDGETLYIADQTKGLLQAELNPETGVATPKACFNGSGSVVPGCTALAAGTPFAGNALDIAGNSRDVYLESISPGGISHFTRTEAGVTSFSDCVSYIAPSAPCDTAAPSPVFSYSGSIGVAGDSLYAEVGNYAPPSGTVSRFSRADDGSLDFVDCATTETAPGPCATLPAGTLTGSSGRLVVSHDGSDLYIGQGGSAERALTRLSASLGFVSCLSDTGIPVCTPPALAAPFAYSVGRIEISPDGRQIYQPAFDAINTYQVEQSAPPAGPSSNPSQGDTPPRLQASSPKIKSVRRDRKGRYLIKVAILEPGELRAGFQGRIKPKKMSRPLGRPATMLAAKAGTFSLRVDPGAAAREKKVRAKLIVSIAPSGYLPAEATRSIRLR